MLRLCQRTNLTPDELDDVDDDTVRKWIAVLDIEAQVVKEAQENARHSR